MDYSLMIETYKIEPCKASLSAIVGLQLCVFLDNGKNKRKENRKRIKIVF